MNPIVSIIIPCYNQAHFLPETIESVFKSTYSNLEIIIVNDGSTDNTQEIAKDFTENHRNIYLLNQKNHGVTHARNAGIEFSRGKYILPLDGDDLISSNYVGDAVEILERRPKVKVVYCEAVKFDGKTQKPWNLKPFSLNALARDNMIFVSGIFRKSDCLAAGGYSENMKMGREDWEFWIKMLKNGGEVVKLPYIGFYYRLHAASKRKKTGTSQKKRERIAYLNEHHSDFFNRELNGPLRYQRSLSKPFNDFLKLIRKL
ncbi:glycosyltransferase [Algoriphagus sp. AGSA1]|uniref:glycosyltransferase family 2 protein n=1 Tax=Algoriphagus sp. AGSA1 TaxID=2907213 RepID=UPI001F16AB2E|nr:glycosyltransferase [Algoriphagus sp. AGSA1]MCE7058042.1 glycosyltransferase [Algoriphagus sp. AGSA1]